MLGIHKFLQFDPVAANQAPSALDMKLEKAHKQLQKETMEQLEKARKAGQSVFRRHE